MLQTFGWVLFGLGIWAACIMLQAFQQRVLPETARRGNINFWHGLWSSGDSGLNDNTLHTDTAGRAELEQEIRQLRERVQVLEAIVTDPKRQFEEQLNA